MYGAHCIIICFSLLAASKTTIRSQRNIPAMLLCISVSPPALVYTSLSRSLADGEKAYETSGSAAEAGALKVIINT